MGYTLNEYYQYCATKATRIEIYSNNDLAADLLAFHIQNGYAVLSISDCISDHLASLPMPDAIMLELDKRIISLQKRIVVVGIDAYLALLDQQNISAFFVALRGRIDEQKLNAVYFLSFTNALEAYFGNPKYENSLQVVKIIGKYEYCEPPRVDIVSAEWLIGNNYPTSYKDLLKRFGDFLPTGDHVLTLKGLHTQQAGLGKNVTFFLNVKQIAKRYYNINADLNPTTLKLLLLKVNEKGLAPESVLANEFGESNINERLAIKRLIKLPDDELWAAYVCLLQKRINTNTYLHKVLSSDVTHDNLLHKYVVDIAVTIIDEQNAKQFAIERAEAVKAIGNLAESLIVEFVNRTQSYESAIEFYNCGTDYELCEVVRRASKCDLTAGLPNVFKGLCPSLEDYLSNDYDYGDHSLNTYFKEYRKLKINNTVSPEFVTKAFDFVVPPPIATRDSVLSDLSSDSQAALLIVDGMGAEYYSLLLATAKRQGINIERSAIVSVKLPTSTKYNPIKWDARRLLDEVRDVDDIVHNGAVKHEHCSPERNISATLRVFETQVINRIVTGLAKYPRVVVTADHGSSRLAVIAHNNGLGATLPWDGQPFDWRYSIEPYKANRPPELESQYNVDDGKNYWIVRGYNRLPKKGPKLNELHGGATMEERLVPLVVFSRSTPRVAPKQTENKPVEQLIEKAGFDI